MKTAAHVAANILAIGALSVAAGSAQKSDGGTTAGSGTAKVAPFSHRAAGASPVAPVRPYLAIRASRNEDRWLPPTMTTTSTTAAPSVTAVTAKASPPTTAASSATAPGDAKMFIFTRESHNNPCAYYPGKSDCNYAGHAACGLGGANPCDKLRVVCLLSDYACQDDWFTNRYMIPRYGTWENAKAHWVAKGWW